MGDAVFELFVRERMIDRGDAPIGDLHLRKVDYVNCASQSEAVSVIEPCLTPEEEAVYKRGRNAHGNVPKNAKPQDYRRATGLEALFGWLYLSGEAARLRELFGIIWVAHEQSHPSKAQVEKAKPAGAVGVRLD